MSNATLKIRKIAFQSIAAKHPWVLSTSLQKSIQPIDKDSVVDLLDQDNRFIARGIFNPDSRIAVRLYSWNENEVIDELLISQRITAAIELRKHRVEFATTSPWIARRLIFSEADWLSGLIVDLYGPNLVVQITASAMYSRLAIIKQCLLSHFPNHSIILRVDESTASKEGLPLVHEVVEGHLDGEPLVIAENGIQFKVDLSHGQKTGHYLDQRQNRIAAASWIDAGSRVLDICCYSGGFACTIANQVSECQVIAIDASQKALDLAAENATLNGLTNIEYEKNDFYQALDQRRQSNETLDAIVLDPPRMAGSRSQVDRALAAYHRLNYSAIGLLRPGGILVTCSCSGRVTRQQFFNMLLGVAKRSRREIQILEQRTAADDHPSLVNCPETDYLKCFICKIL